MVDYEAALEKLCSTEQGRLKGTFILSTLNKVAASYADPVSRPKAEAFLATWTDGSQGELKKGMAVAWLARARTAIAGSTMVRGAAAAAGRVDAKVGNIGAAAGHKLAHSPLNAAGMGAARHAGGLEAQSRMAARLQPGAGAARPSVDARVQTALPSARDRTMSQGNHGFVEPQAHRNFGREQRAASGNTPTGLSPEHRTAAVHADAMRTAHAAGAASAGESHAAHAAKLGRVAARNGFRAGLAVAGAGAAAAGIHAALPSDKKPAQ